MACLSGVASKEPRCAAESWTFTTGSRPPRNSSRNTLWSALLWTAGSPSCSSWTLGKPCSPNCPCWSGGWQLSANFWRRRSLEVTVFCPSMALFRATTAAQGLSPAIARRASFCFQLACTGPKRVAELIRTAWGLPMLPSEERKLLILYNSNSNSYSNRGVARIF